MPCLRGRHVMEALSTGLLGSCDITSRTTQWNGVAGIAETSSHVFVMLAPEQGYVIPRKRIVSGDLDRFVEAVRAHMAAN